MEISIKDDLKQLSKTLNRVQRKQIPFATSQAINDVAFMAQKELKSEAQIKLHNPTPFTLRGFRVNKATKATMSGMVYVHPIVAAYLVKQIEGGTSGPTAVPVNIKLNKYGNIPNRRKGIVKTAKQFIGTYKGTYGVWETTKKGGGGSIKLLAAYHDKVVYKKIFDFYKIVNGVVRYNFNRQLEKRVKVAIANAK